MKNYSLIALALFLGALLAACVGCAPANTKPTHTVQVLTLHGETVRTYQTSCLWYTRSNGAGFADSKTGLNVYVEGLPVIVEPIKGTEGQ